MRLFLYNGPLIGLYCLRLVHIDRSLEYTSDKRFVYKYTDYDTHQEVEEEWYLIAIKYHYITEGKYETIVYIN